MKKIYPNILIDTYELIHFLGTPYAEELDRKMKTFKDFYKIEDWNRFVQSIAECLDRKIVDFYRNYKGCEKNEDIVEVFLRENDFDTVDSQIIKKMQGGTEKWTSFWGEY